jgi:dinuclear metal center YbgI/SA1388 family protein
MRLNEICTFLESLAPLSSQESYDNAGLLVGDPKSEVKQALISLDCTEAILDEAIEKGCDLIISHHPIVFGGLKKLNGKTYVERVVIKAIQNNIALYAIHTNLDNYRHGVNEEICERIGLKNCRILQAKKSNLLKLVTYVPPANREIVLKALFEEGAGNIGNYSHCSFSSTGTGTFLPNQDANPVIGEKGQLHEGEEGKVEVVLSIHNERQVIQALKKAHPYEEIAYEVYDLRNSNHYEGAGMIGELESPISEMEFLRKIKTDFKCGAIRHTELLKKEVKNVAVCGGAGSFLLKSAIDSGADVFVTADMKYHEFFDADSKILIADVGHYESEQYTSERLERILKKKFPKFALRLTGINTNPINYI